MNFKALILSVIVCLMPVCAQAERTFADMTKEERAALKVNLLSRAHEIESMICSESQKKVLNYIGKGALVLCGATVCMGFLYQYWSKSFYSKALKVNALADEFWNQNLVMIGLQGNLDIPMVLASLAELRNKAASYRLEAGNLNSNADYWDIIALISGIYSVLPSVALSRQSDLSIQLSDIKRQLIELDAAEAQSAA